jgi:hypothetical protein
MPITYTCQCGKTLHVKDRYAGKRVKCPACRRTIQFPGLGDSVPSALHKIIVDGEDATVAAPSPAAQADQPVASPPPNSPKAIAQRLRFLQTFILALAGIIFFLGGWACLANTVRRGDSAGWFLCCLACWLIMAVNQTRWNAQDRG